MIKIKTKKFVDQHGQRCREVISYSALRIDELPKEYRDTAPSCHSYGGQHLAVYGVDPQLSTAGGRVTCLKPGCSLTEEQFGEALRVIRLAGQRLSSIRREHQQLAKEFGAGEIEIFMI